MRSIVKKLGAWLLLFVLTLAVAYPNCIVADAVTPSTIDYTVLLNGPRYFIHNEKTVGSEVGTEYYMTYTVKSAKQVPTQHGLVGTDDFTRNFPYTEGGLMRYAGAGQDLLAEGWSYFVKFTVAEGGFVYNITRAKGDAIEDITMEKITGEATAKLGYFGIWLAYDAVEAELSDVRFYDAKGKDLGVKLECPTGAGIVMAGNGTLKKATSLDHRYDVVVTHQKNIGISNVRIPTTPRIYMEYTVESAEYMLNQEGMALSNDPESDYPHRYGILRYVPYSEITDSLNFLESGAEYIVLIERQEKTFNVLVQKTKDGKTNQYMLTNLSGKYDKAFDYVSLWFGAGGDTDATFKLTDVKIYDANYNNLGVQTNVTSNIMHYGEMEDYAGCEAAYYCKKNGNLMALYADQTMKHTVGLLTDKATYKISDNVMKAKFASGEEQYEYLYKKITTDEDDVYERLYHYRVSFVTGTDTEIPTQELSNEKGYHVMEPEQPTMEGYEFQGWYTSEGEEFNFEQIVTESATLYAKWSGDGGITFLAGDEVTQESNSAYLLFGAGGLLLLVGLIICVFFIRKGMKNGSIKKN